MKATRGSGLPTAARSGVLIVALALTVFLVACDEPVGVQPSPTPTASAAPSASPVATPSPPGETPDASPPAVGWAWEVHELPGGPARGAAWIDDRWVALDGLQAWTSTDGVTWDTAQVDGTPQEADGQMNLGPVAILGDSSYAVGM
jgi:hypothetical protein